MEKVSDEYLLTMIRKGKKNGSIRNDIDDKILSLYITGVPFRMKEYHMSKARNKLNGMLNYAPDSYRDY